MSTEPEEQLTMAELKHLPAETSRVAKRRLRGLSQEKIAEELGISKHHVEKHLRQACRLLGKSFPRLPRASRGPGLKPSEAMLRIEREAAAQNRCVRCLTPGHDVEDCDLGDASNYLRGGWWW